MVRKALFATGLLLIILSIPSSAQNNWISLFNGENLNGWTVMNEAKFEVDKESGELLLVDGMGWLRTDMMYKDFILELEFFPMERNFDSGIFFWAGIDGEPWPDRGYQVNLRQRGLGDLVVGYNAIHKARMEPRLEGAWLTLTLHVEGPKASLKIDGESVWEKDDLQEGRGFIGIQAEKHPFKFRNLRIKEIGYTNLLEGQGQDFQHLQVQAGSKKAWKIDENGVLVCEGKGGGWIGTQKGDYSDFDFKFEFNVPKEGNSGVYIRRPAQGDGAYSGMEIQIIDDDAKHWGELQRWQLTGSIYHEVPPSVRAFREAGEWQSMEILAKDQFIQIFLNGIQIIDTNLNEYTESTTNAPPLKERPREGYLGFQNYDGHIQYRNVRVKRLEE